jgi:alpha-1,2-mannosyltransferase
MAFSSNDSWWWRVRLILWLVVIGYAAYTLAQYYQGYESASRGARPMYTDYSHTYASSIMLRDRLPEDLYRDDLMRNAMREAAVAMYGDELPEQHLRAIGFSPWMYPPTFMFVVAPLAYLPYLISLLAWTLATLVPYLLAMRMTLRDSFVWPLSLSGPPVFYNLVYGQSGFLSAGFIGMGLASLQRHPFLAGLSIGLASVKPHLGVLIPVALAAGGHWWTFSSAAATTLALILASGWAFGLEPWLATIGSLDFYFEGFRVGGYNFSAMTSVAGAVRLAGGGTETMWLVQNVATLTMIGLVAWVWWRGKDQADTLGLQSAILCLATPLAIPFIFIYDLVILLPAVGWLVQDYLRRGFARWEIAVLGGAAGLLLIAPPLAKASGLQLGPVLIAVILAHAVDRYLRALRPATLAAQTASPAAQDLDLNTRE